MEVDEVVNEQIAEIERENRDFWSRMLRDRFGRDVTLVVDWDSFITGSTEAGWPLCPLNIQTAGIERLLYALTGLMDHHEKFSMAAFDRIESLYVANAVDIDAVKLAFHKGRLTYRCFAGDWDGYFTIDEIRQDLKGRIIGKTRIRKILERWLEKVFGGPGQRTEPIGIEPQAVAEESALPSGPAIQGRPEYSIEEYDASLRAELESVYDRFIMTITERDLDGLLSLVETSRTDEETLRKEMSSDGFVSLSQWMLTVYPQLEQTTFISLKSEDDDFAGYYMAWIPSYSHDYHNLTLIRFERGGGQWKMLFSLSEPASAIVQVRKDGYALAKVQEVMNTNPLMMLKRRQPFQVPEEIVEQEPPEELARLKEELDAVLRTFYGALERRDINAFLAMTILSQDDEERLRKNPQNLCRQILENTPEPSPVVFVKLQTRGDDQAGFYFVAPFPANPAFDFVYLRPFVYHDGRWKMVFSPLSRLHSRSNLTPIDRDS